MERKRSKVFLFAAAVAVIAGVLFYHLFAPGIVLGIARGAASRSLGSEVSIRSLGFSVIRGRAEARGIAVANMEGFDAENIMTVDRVRVSFVPASFFRDTIEFHEIDVEGVAVFVQQEGRRNNLVEFQAGMPRDPVPPEPSGKEVSVDTVKIEGIELHIQAPGHSGYLMLDPIVLEDIHTAEGVGIGEVSARVARAVAGGALRQIAGGAVPEGEAGEALRSVRDKSRDMLEDAVEGIRGLLP